MGKLSPKEGQAIFSTKKESEGVTWSLPSFISEQGDKQAHGDSQGTNEPVSKCVGKSHTSLWPSQGRCVNGCGGMGVQGGRDCRVEGRRHREQVISPGVVREDVAHKLRDKQECAQH